MTSIDGVEFEAAWHKRRVALFEGLSIPVLSRADLIANKRACNRPKDLADVDWLEKHEDD